MDKNQRIYVLLILMLLLGALLAFPIEEPRPSRAELSVVAGGLLMLSFTVLLLEHFFAKPTDVLSAAVSILLLLIPSREMFRGWGAWYSTFVAYEIIAAFVATLALLLLTDEGPQALRNRTSNALKVLVVRLAGGRVQYFLLSFLATVFFVRDRSPHFLGFLAYAILVATFEPQRITKWLPSAVRRPANEIGEIIAVQGGRSFLIRLHSGKEGSSLRLGAALEFNYGGDQSSPRRRAVVVEKLFLDQSQWVRAVCHPSIDVAYAARKPIVEARTGGVYQLPEIDQVRPLEGIVGFVSDGANITTLRFLQAEGAGLSEGDLVEVDTANGKVVYQIVNAKVDSKTIDARNEADFVNGEAIQLGRWNPVDGTFVRHGWVPVAREPVSRFTPITPPIATKDEIELGIIPGTNVPVFLNRREAVSHHTAVLGVTGVGKSMFARDLVRQLTEDDLRIIVVDFTREWKTKLTGKALPLIIDDAASKPLRDAIKAIDEEEAEFKNKQDAKRIAENKKVLAEGFKAAIDAFTIGTTSVGVLELPDLSNTEGVLQYTQWFFMMLFRLARDGKLNGKRVCIVLEEAHTVVPEWNFLGIADKSSQSLVNNISQIALQGRKYGVGFVVIAQRTASVSKTVLTQCNTLIAFQCFDGTSLEFLSHYLPPSVVSVLPNLAPRRAVAVGKAIRGSVPLIFDVPDLTQKEIAKP